MLDTEFEMGKAQGLAAFESIRLMPLGSIHEVVDLNHSAYFLFASLGEDPRPRDSNGRAARRIALHWCVRWHGGISVLLSSAAAELNPSLVRS